MKRLSPRRLGTLVVLTLASAALTAVVPAGASTGAIDYTCALPLGNSATLAINTDTDAPAEIPPNVAIHPKLSVSVVLPAAFVDGLRTQGGFTAIAGKSGTASITTNGTSTPVSVTFPKKNLPASGPMTVVPTGTLPPTSLPNEGTITFKPGNLTMVMTASGDFSNDISFNCPLPVSGNSAVIDTVNVTSTAPPPPTKATSDIGVRSTYVRSTKKLTVLVKVIIKGSSTIPTGTVRVNLFKGGVYKKGATLTLKGGYVKPVFTRIGRGTYTEVVTYSGSSTVKGLQVKRTLTLR